MSKHKRSKRDKHKHDKQTKVELAPKRDFTKSQLLCAIVQHLSWGGFQPAEIIGLIATNPPLTPEQIVAMLAGPDYRKAHPPLQSILN